MSYVFCLKPGEILTPLHKRPARPTGMPFLDDNEYGVWLDPAPKSLREVPETFATCTLYCNTIQNNLLTEYYEFFNSKSNEIVAMIFHEKDKEDDSVHFWLPKKNGKFEEGSLFFNLFYLREDGNAARFLVVGVDEEDDGFWVCLKTTATNRRVFVGDNEDLKERVYKFIHLGYIGDFVSEYKALKRLSKYEGGNNVINSIVNPKLLLKGGWKPLSQDWEDTVKKRECNCPNDSQCQAVRDLTYAVEKIQGPPGTGKSTTIFHVISTRLPNNEIAFVTCTRNVAVAAIVEKVSVAVNGELLAFGSRLEPIAKRFTVEKRYEALPCVSTATKMLEEWNGELSGCKKDEGKMKPCIECKENWSKYEKKREEYEKKEKKKEKEEAPTPPVRKCKKCRIEATDLWRLMYRYCVARAAAVQLSETLSKQKPILMRGIFSRARVFVASVASCGKVLREYKNYMEQDLRVHTVIVDECGCVKESSTALLANLYPQSFLLVGDHKQIEPFSLLQKETLLGTNHNRSLLERCIDASNKYHFLSEQYRMHPRIAGYVSDAFYGNRLTTPASVQLARGNVSSTDALRLINCKDEEETHPGKSTMNKKQADLTIKKACEVMRKYRPPKGNVAILTFYAAQVRELKMRVAADAELAGRVEVFTVDKCQGIEFEHVLLSTVRCNREKRVGFLKNKARVNVACSRARSTLTVVGCRKTLARGGVVWRKLLSACSN